MEYRGEDIRLTQVKLFELDKRYEVIEVLGYGGWYYFMALCELQVHHAATRKNIASSKDGG